MYWNFKSLHFDSQKQCSLGVVCLLSAQCIEQHPFQNAELIWLRKKLILWTRYYDYTMWVKRNKWLICLVYSQTMMMTWLLSYFWLFDGSTNQGKRCYVWYVTLRYGTVTWFAIQAFSFWWFHHKQEDKSKHFCKFLWIVPDYSNCHMDKLSSIQIWISGPNRPQHCYGSHRLQEGLPYLWRRWTWPLCRTQTARWLALSSSVLSTSWSTRKTQKWKKARRGSHDFEGICSYRIKCLTLQKIYS